MMIKVGIIENETREERAYQVLREIKEIEPSGIYSPGKDFKSERLRCFHNPVELLELSDAILVCDNERITPDFIRLMIRKSKHLFFRTAPDFQIQDAKEILQLHKEAGNTIHLLNRLLFINPNLSEEIESGAKLINIVSSCSPGNMLIDEIIDNLLFLSKIENASIKHFDVYGLERNNGSTTVHLKLNYSNGSVHSLLVSKEKIDSQIQIFQKNRFIQFNVPEPDPQSDQPSEFDIAAVRNFISDIENKKSISISFEDYYGSLRFCQEIRDKLKYSGIII